MDDSGVTGLVDGGAVGAACTTDQQCKDSQLCCGSPGEKRCTPTDPAKQCTACNTPCPGGSDTEVSCGERVCECAPGSGKSCGTGEYCMNVGGGPKCVGCRSSADCATTSGRNVCVDNNCVACDPDTNEGCLGDKPKCNADGVCDNCVNDSDCPDGLSCNGALGCFGCKIEADIGENNCEPATPVCRGTTAGPQCVGCQSNADCSGGFCDEMTNRCHKRVRPAPIAAGQDGNGCTKPEAPICKVGPTGEVTACPAR